MLYTRAPHSFQRFHENFSQVDRTCHRRMPEHCIFAGHLIHRQRIVRILQKTHITQGHVSTKSRATAVPPRPPRTLSCPPSFGVPAPHILEWPRHVAALGQGGRRPPQMDAFPPKRATCNFFSTQFSITSVIRRPNVSYYLITTMLVYSVTETVDTASTL